jgi:hypothetical protein
MFQPLVGTAAASEGLHLRWMNNLNPTESRRGGKQATVPVGGSGLWRRQSGGAGLRLLSHSRA